MLDKWARDLASNPQYDSHKGYAHEGEWEVELREPTSNKTVVGEIEGSEAPIDVEKFRQLLNYFQAEVLEGRIHKGILLGTAIDRGNWTPQNDRASSRSTY